MLAALVMVLASVGAGVDVDDDNSGVGFRFFRTALPFWGQINSNSK